MKNWFRSSLIRQLHFFLMGIILSLAAAFIITNLYVRNNMRQNTLDMNERILLQIGRKLEDYRDRIGNIAAALVYSPTTKEYFGQGELDRVISAGTMETVFTNIMLLDRDIVGIVLYDMELERIAFVGRRPDVDMESEGLKDHLEFGSFSGTDEPERAYYPVYYPVYDLESRQYGVQIGMAVLVMKADGLSDFLLDSGVTQNTEIYLLDGKGVGVDSSGGMAALEEEWQSDRGYLVQRQEAAMEGWQVVSRIPRRDLTGGTGGSMGLVGVSYGIAVILIGMLVYFFYANFIRRIYRMDQFIRNVAREPGKRMAEDGADEIGRVIGSLNGMLDEREKMDAEIQDSQKRMYETELAKKQLQILAYRNQINPHFLYNTFECIRGMALYHDMDDIAEITMALSKVFRFAVKEDNIVTVRDEIDYIKEYATIIEYRFMGKIDVNIDADEELFSRQVIKLILQPVVENAVFHGLEQEMEDGEVTVTIRRKWDDYIMFLVEDNGCGMEEERVRQLLDSLEKRLDGKGIGLANIYQRLHLFYGEDVVFEIRSTPGAGTRVMIVVPDHVEDKLKR